MRVDLVLDRSLSMIQKQQLKHTEQVFQPKWERAEVGPWNSCWEQWPFVSCDIFWADKWRSEEEIISVFPNLFVLWKYIQSSLWLETHHPVLSLLRAFVSAVSSGLQSAPWDMGQAQKGSLGTELVSLSEWDTRWRGGEMGNLPRFSMKSLVLEVLERVFKLRLISIIYPNVALFVQGEEVLPVLWVLTATRPKGYKLQRMGIGQNKHLKHLGSETAGNSLKEKKKECIKVIKYSLLLSQWVPNPKPVGIQETVLGYIYISIYLFPSTNYWLEGRI